MVKKLQDIDLKELSSEEEKVHTMELGQKSKKAGGTLHFEPTCEGKGKSVGDKFDAYGLVKLLLEDF